ncbi:MAG: hypothetical protein IT173_13755 [Acidobacteria bacterium]|nr:hypothetical protein [Acidobacteriota bacterium]
MFIKESIIKAPPERMFAFHELPDAFERLISPWGKAKVIQKADISQLGSSRLEKLFEYRHQVTRAWCEL